jgi:hypothetical protein
MPAMLRVSAPRACGCGGRAGGRVHRLLLRFSHGRLAALTDYRVRARCQYAAFVMSKDACCLRGRFRETGVRRCATARARRRPPPTGAGSVEVVLRRAGIEPVSRHLSLAAQQFEIPGCDGDVQYPFLRTNRAVALWRSQQVQRQRPLSRRFRSGDNATGTLLRWSNPGARAEARAYADI